MRPAMTLKNLFIAVFVLPLRISLFLLLWAIECVGGYMAYLVELIPGLEPDQKYEALRAKKRRQQVIDGMGKLATKRNSL